MSEDKYLPYSGLTVEDLRRAIMRHVDRAEKGEPMLLSTESELKLLRMLLVQYGYGIAAVLRWLGENAGPGVQFEAARFLDDIWMNGDDDNTNADVMPAKES